MGNDLKKNFSHLKPMEPPSGLFDKIIARIHYEERLLSAKKHLVLFFILMLISAFSFVPTINELQREFTGSGFSRILSLLFSDLRLVMENWQDFGLALLESLPSMSLIAFLLATLAFLWSINHLAKITKIMSHTPQMIGR